MAAALSALVEIICVANSECAIYGTLYLWAVCTLSGLYIY